MSQVERAATARHLAALLSNWGAGPIEELLQLIEPDLSALDAQAFARLVELSRNTGNSWGFHPPAPFVRGLSRKVIERVLEPGSALEEGAGLAAAGSSPAIWVGNHLSYVDVNVLDCLLAREGHADLADRITALVGPKVYTEPIRRLASLCFGTIKIPQSQSVASDQAALSAREIAQISSHALEIARERCEAGDQLLVFPEGSRSRTHSLRPLLPAASRYLEQVDGVVVVFAHWGTERLVPLTEDRVHPTRVQVRIGGAFAVHELLERCPRRAVLSDTIGFLIADLLPPAYRGVYGGVEPGREAARKIASDVGAR